ncbi:hypothetical protein [Micromonospora sp. NPDC005413]|uniref:hypothetical protein n=1 Tax=Micromonospora sp. NPDC005413 TaxID=3154563 RepID=UPI0033AFEBE5
MSSTETVLVVAAKASVSRVPGSTLPGPLTPDLVMDHLSIAAPVEPEVVRHLESGRTIEAVRAYRKHTGTSLVEAKRAVDRIAAGLHLER